MVSSKLLAVLVAVNGAFAFPSVPNIAGVHGGLFRQEKRQQNPVGVGAERNCPYNPNHVPAAPFNPKYPYNNAQNGLPGLGKGGYKVPADGDTAHYFVPPDPKKDIRGPCPGLNTLANHNFISHDGIVTFNELVDGCQNGFNMAYDLAVFLAVVGLTTTAGDTTTERLSIGCDATNRTSFNPQATGHEPGLAGHNKFEADASLTREDYFIAHPRGDDFIFNGTRFGDMVKSTGGLFDRAAMSKYRLEVYNQSRQINPNFYFGPFAVLQYGASSFLYTIFPSGTRNYVPDLYTISSFFGAKKTADGRWVTSGGERFPENWTNAVVPVGNPLTGAEIFEQILLNPVEFGGSTGDGSFNVVSGPRGLIQNGNLGSAVNASTASCFLYMLATERVATSLNSVLVPSVEALSFAVSKLRPGFKNLGCPMHLT